MAALSENEVIIYTRVPVTLYMINIICTRVSVTKALFARAGVLCLVQLPHENNNY